MPKRIDDVKGRIIESASILFSKSDYNKVKMEDIALYSNIAVGTLYNYYKNKRILFLSVIEKQLDNLYLKLNNILYSEISIKELVTNIYYEINDISELCEEILYLTKEETVIVKKMKNDLLQKINNMIINNKWNKKIETFSDYNNRMILLILYAIINLEKEYPEQRKKNIEFISDFIKVLVS